MSAVSLPLPSFRHYLTAWLKWIEYTLPGSLQGCVLSTCVFEVALSHVRIHDQRYLYADDIVYEPSERSLPVTQVTLAFSNFPLPEWGD